jgi:hypothetical protein
MTQPQSAGHYNQMKTGSFLENPTIKVVGLYQAENRYDAFKSVSACPPQMPFIPLQTVVGLYKHIYRAEDTLFRVEFMNRQLRCREIVDVFDPSL